METTCHILWRCPSSNDMWGDCAKKIQNISNGGEDFMLILGVLLERLEELELVAIIV